MPESEFRFTCSSCGESLLASESHRGQTVKCPSCSALVVADDGTQAAAPGGPAADVSGATIRCPYCAEEIRAEAVKCKHCGSFVRDAGQGPPQAPYQGARPTTSGLAIASLVLGCIPLTCFPSLLAIIFGHVALAKINASNGQLKGRKMATAGLILGYIFTALNIMYGVWRGLQAA